MVRKTSTGRRLLLILLIAPNLRSVILAVPTVLPQVRADLHLTFAEAGALTSLPVLCLGLAAVPGALFTNRYGARLVIGLTSIGLGVGGILRLLPPPLLGLFTGTLLLSVCIAMCQPAASSLIRGWFPGSVQRASVLYTLALNLGGVAGATVTVFLVAVWGWRGTFVLWALPALLAGLAWIVLAPKDDDTTGDPPRVRTLLREPGVWRAAGLFASQSLIYFTATTWLPFLLQSRGRGMVALALALMGLSVMAAGMGLALWGRPYASRPAFYVVAGLLSAGGALGLAAGPQDWAWVCAATLGLGSGLGFTGSMALPPTLAAPSAVAGYSALMLTAGYALAFVGPYAGGLLADATGSVRAPFALLVVSAAAMVALGLSLSRARS